MKHLIACCLLVGELAAGQLFGQGTLDFANSANSLVYYTCSQDPHRPVGQGIVQAGLYYTTDLGASPSPYIPDDGWILVPESITPVTTSALSFAQGRFSKSPVAVSGQTGTILVQARIWSVHYDTYEQAIRGVDGRCGASDFGRIVLATGPFPRQTTADIFTSEIICGPLTCIPEPSTLVLSLLGGAVVWFMAKHRR